jgi:hypothetical protein
VLGFAITTLIGRLFVSEHCRMNSERSNAANQSSHFTETAPTGHGLMTKGVIAYPIKFQILCIDDTHRLDYLSIRHEDPSNIGVASGEL